MLHQTAVPLNLWQALLDLQEPLADSGFALAGGTSLALRLGHRQSVDLDFFTPDAFDPESLATRLGIDSESITGMASGTLQLRRHDLKMEFLRHGYPPLRDLQQLDGIRLWSLEDVAAMKINAIVNRGSKKDFYDLAALLDAWPLGQLLEHYQQKYRPGSLLMAIRSLAWFEDADAEPDPISLTGATWPEIVEKIKTAIRQLE